MAFRALPAKKSAVAAALLGALATGAYLLYLQPASSSEAGGTAQTSEQAASGKLAAASATSASSAPAASAGARLRTREQAAAALMALPELQTWAALLEKNSGGKTHGALIEYDPTPRQVHGKTYWQFSFVENSAETALRWESFLASTSDEEILVEDAATDELLSLARWRKEKQPARRTSIDG